MKKKNIYCIVLSLIQLIKKKKKIYIVLFYLFVWFGFIFHSKFDVLFKPISKRLKYIIRKKNNSRFSVHLNLGYYYYHSKLVEEKKTMIIFLFSVQFMSSYGKGFSAHILFCQKRATSHSNQTVHQISGPRIELTRKSTGATKSFCPGLQGRQGQVRLVYQVSLS